MYADLGAYADSEVYAESAVYAGFGAAISVGRFAPHFGQNALFLEFVLPQEQVQPGLSAALESIVEKSAGRSFPHLGQNLLDDGFVAPHAHLHTEFLLMVSIPVLTMLREPVGFTFQKTKFPIIRMLPRMGAN